MKAIVSRKGQLVIPAGFRQREDIQPGQQFDIRRINPNEFRLSRKNGKHAKGSAAGQRSNGGLVNWLLACPEKDYFVSIESESTDTNGLSRRCTRMNADKTELLPLTRREGWG
jgi:hypothetical protein